jgi:hypothetical protein
MLIKLFINEFKSQESIIYLPLIYYSYVSPIQIEIKTIKREKSLLLKSFILIVL